MSKLIVYLHRQTKEEPGTGTIRAYVIQEGQRGSNLLPGAVTNIDTAKRRVGNIIVSMYGLGKLPEVEFTGDALEVRP